MIFKWGIPFSRTQGPWETFLGTLRTQCFIDPLVFYILNATLLTNNYNIVKLW